MIRAEVFTTRSTTRICDCGGDSGVIDCRVGGAGMVNRRRKCMNCGLRWTTVEKRVDVGSTFVLGVRPRLGGMPRVTAQAYNDARREL